MPTTTHRTLTAVAVLAAVAVTVVWVVFVRNEADEAPVRAAAGWALTVAGCGALYWRRRWPVAVAVFVLACTLVYFPITTQDVPVLVLALAVALYTVAAERRLAAAVTIALVTLLIVGYGELGISQGRRHVDDAALFLLVGWFVGLIAAGYAQRTRQAYLREVEQRALAAEREKDVRARQSATEERLRIARELHDELGHSISLISVQAAAALHRQARDPSRVGELVSAMESVRDASRDALRELRATLGVLRQVDEAASMTGGAASTADEAVRAGDTVRAADVAPAAPVEAGLSGIEGLGERAVRAGVDVRVSVDVRAELPPRAGAAAYRIVQESLTNVVRHAHARTARVCVRDEGEGESAVLRVRVEDDGRGAPPGVRGSGISGMEERARALGGTLSVRSADGDGEGSGTGAGTGFVVEARLPFGELTKEAR
jgi:signal transduction histidine kinase